MVTLDPDGRVTHFEEKPKRTRSTLASMGIYAFSATFWRSGCTGEGLTQHDFGREVLPTLGRKRRACTVLTIRDIGRMLARFKHTLKRTWRCSGETPALDLYDPEWIIHTRSEERPAVYVGGEARVDGNLLCDGCRIDGTVTRRSLDRASMLRPGAVVRDSILMKDVVVGEGAAVDRVLLTNVSSLAQARSWAAVMTTRRINCPNAFEYRHHGHWEAHPNSCRNFHRAECGN